MPRERAYTSALALIDVDGDRDQDLVVGNGDEPGHLHIDSNLLCLNDGAGRFAFAGFPSDADVTEAIAPCDVDGDGDMDLLFANTGNTGGQNRLYLNDGLGNFGDATALRLPVDADESRDVATGDIDGDGDVDVVFANNNGSSRIYLNDGTGRYSDATMGRLPAGVTATRVSLGDLDLDGDSDLLLGGRVFLNDGVGAFAEASATRVQPDAGVTISDIDGDGDGDLVSAQRILFNLLRQVEAPFIVGSGREYRIDAYARFGPPRIVDVALPYVALTSAHIPVPPFGTLLIDPVGAIPMPAIVISQPSGVGSSTAMIPTGSTLVGLEVRAQALSVPWPGEGHLTNVVIDRVAR